MAPQEPGWWIQNHLKIQTKGGKLIPFRFNSIQRILYRKAVECWQKRQPIKFLIPKYRQGGVSTWVQAMLFERTFRLANRNACVVAHDDDGAINIFRMAQTFLEELPEVFRDSRPTKYAGKNTMEFSPPHRSRYVVDTVRTGDALGKSFSYQMIHGSEVASWSDKGNEADRAWISITNAVPDDPNTMEFLESTGNGRDPFFYPKVTRALQPGYTGDWQVIFLPWYLHTDYRRKASGKFKHSEDERALVDDVMDRAGVFIDEDQLEWRRYCIEDKCEGSTSLFRRYYPSFLHECFEATETSYFPVEIREYYERNTRDAEDRGEIAGVYGYDKPEFEPNERGVVRLWDKPRPDQDYVIFSDLAEGGPLGDYDCAYVLWKNARSVVACAHGNRDSDEWANLLAQLGQWYNWALIGVENNTKQDVIRRLWHELKYPRRRLYWDKDLLHAKKNRKMYRPGWNTNKKTRPIMLQALKKVLRKQYLVCPDSLFVKELHDFVYNERTGRFEAAEGEHDDRIMSMAGLVAISGIDYDGGKTKQATVEKETALDRKKRRDRERHEIERAMKDIRGGNSKGGYIG